MKFFLCASGCLRKGPRAGIYAGSWLQQFRPDSRHGAFSAGGSWPWKPEVRRDRGDGTLSRGPVISVTDITRSNTVRKGSSAQAVSEDQLFYALCGVTVAGAHEETPESGNLPRVKAFIDAADVVDDFVSGSADRTRREFVIVVMS